MPHIAGVQRDLAPEDFACFNGKSKGAKTTADDSDDDNCDDVDDDDVVIVDDDD